MDALNALNHPVFAVYPNNAGGADFMGAPSTATLTTAGLQHLGYRQQPTAVQRHRRHAGQHHLQQHRQHGERAEDRRRRAAGQLLHHPAAGQNFYGKAANSYDITTLNGYKLYQLRTAYATNFGTLYNNGTPRYVQFGVKLYF